MKGISNHGGTKIYFLLGTRLTYYVRRCRYFRSLNWQDRGGGSGTGGEESQRLLWTDSLRLELGPAVGHRPFRDVDPVYIWLPLLLHLLLVHVVSHDCRCFTVGAGEDVGHLVHDRPLCNAHAPLALLHQPSHVKY